MSKERENNFDLLRILCTIGVILLHISSIFMNGVTDETSLGGLYQQYTWEVCLFYVAPRFAVPCFVMLSGAFILADGRNADFGFFYKKSWKRLGIPTLIFSAGYTIFSIMKSVISCGGVFTPDMVIEPLKYWAVGFPYYHMWYLYMLIGLYVMAPAVILVRQHVSEKAFELAAWVLLAVGCLSGMTSTYTFFWDFGYSFCYLGYFMLGYVLRKKFLVKKYNTHGICMIFCGILIEYAMAILWYNQAVIGEMATFFNYSIIEPLSPMTACAAILIFMGFARLDIKINFGRAAADTFLIYMIHAAFVTVYHAGIRHYMGVEADARIMIPLGVIVIYAASGVFARAWEESYSRIVKRKEKI